MMPRRLSALLAAMVMLAVAIPVHADDTAIINRWYMALLAADRAGLSDLLSDDARINLVDLDIEQNKQEFIDSMGEWEAAVEGGTIRHRIEKTEDGVSTVITCYDFPGNDMLMQETFAVAVADNRITASSQAIVAENCDGY